MSTETLVPAIQSITKDNLIEVAKAIKMLLDVREGRVGDPLDANVTYRDLVKAGALAVRPGWNGGTASPVIPAWAGDDGYDPTADMTQPPQPTGFVLSAGLTSIMLQWGAWTYRNHSYAEVWRGETDAVGSATLIGTSDTRFFVDAVGSTNKTYYYWVRFVSQANAIGPFNSTVGTMGKTGLVGGTDLSDLIITANKLATDAVESGKIKDFAVTTTKIANLAVGNAAIANLAVTNAKIADLAVDNAKIASLDAAKINTGFLSADRIQAGSIDAKIANIEWGVIRNVTVQRAQIADAAINTAKIEDGSISTAKIAQYIQSSNFSSGSAGWRINKDGSAEFNGAVFRGTVDLKSSTSGTRMEMNNSVIKVFDGGVLRVKIGDLNA